MDIQENLFQASLDRFRGKRREGRQRQDRGKPISDGAGVPNPIATTRGKKGRVPEKSVSVYGSHASKGMGMWRARREKEKRRL